MSVHKSAIRGTLSCLMLAVATLVPPSHAEESASKLYRAYEPASLQLDINLQQDTLSLFLSINSEAVTAITKQPVHFLTRYLNAFTPLATLPEDAKCRQTQKQFLAEPEEKHFLKTESLPGSNAAQQITGYLEYKCLSPEKLSHLIFRGFKPMPGLKHVSVWLISDNWQSKQQLSQRQKRVQLQKKRGLTYLLLELFNHYQSDAHEPDGDSRKPGTEQRKEKPPVHPIADRR